MDLKIPGQLWDFKENKKGEEIGSFLPYKKDNQVYIDRDHFFRLKEVYAKRIKHKWDNWIIYAGDEGDGKSTLAKQDCYVEAMLCGGKFDVNNIAWEPDKFAKLIDDSNPGDSILYDEAITGMDSQRTMSEVNHILKVKSTMCRKKRLFVAICIPSLFDLQKGIAVRRTFGMLKVYADEVKRGYYSYYNRSDKRKLYILGKKYEDMDAWKGGPGSRFLKWSFIDERKYELYKDAAQDRLNVKETSFNKYKEQRNALLVMLKESVGWSQSKISEELTNFTHHNLSQQAISDVYKAYKVDFARNTGATSYRKGDYLSNPTQNGKRTSIPLPG